MYFFFQKPVTASEITELSWARFCSLLPNNKNDENVNGTVYFSHLKMTEMRWNIRLGRKSNRPPVMWAVCKSRFSWLSLCVFVSSYLHCEWATEQHLEKDKRIQQKIKRFKMKQAQRALFFTDVRLHVYMCANSLFHLFAHRFMCPHSNISN